MSTVCLCVSMCVKKHKMAYVHNCSVILIPLLLTVSVLLPLFLSVLRRVEVSPCIIALL